MSGKFSFNFLFLIILRKKEYYPACSIFMGGYVRCVIARLIINVHAMRVTRRGLLNMSVTNSLHVRAYHVEFHFDIYFKHSDVTL